MEEKNSVAAALQPPNQEPMCRWTTSMAMQSSDGRMEEGLPGTCSAIPFKVHQRIASFSAQLPPRCLSSANRFLYFGLLPNSPLTKAQKPTPEPSQDVCLPSTVLKLPSQHSCREPR